MRKLKLIQLILTMFFSLGYGQVNTEYFPDKSALEQPLIRNHQKSATIKRMPSFNIQKMIEEDKLNESLDMRLSQNRDGLFFLQISIQIDFFSFF